jgi:hypothetical protein
MPQDQDKPEMFTCYDCGRTSTDPTRFIIINTEPPSLSMDSPYPGYKGDLICREWCEPTN